VYVFFGIPWKNAIITTHNRLALLPLSLETVQLCILKPLESTKHGKKGVQWRPTSQSDHKPVFIMLTDSGDWCKQQSLAYMRQIMAAEASLPEAEQLTLHMIGFGPSVDHEFVEDLATIGNGSHLVCQTGGEVDRLDLVKAFSRLAAEPALKVSLLQQLRGGQASRSQVQR
jgi:hypothetical protein